MDLAIFLILLTATQSKAHRPRCDPSDDYYQNRHHGIRRLYDRATLSPEEYYIYRNSLDDDYLDSDISVIDNEQIDSELPIVVLSKKSIIRGPKLIKISGRYTKSNHLGDYSNYFMAIPRSLNNYPNKDRRMVLINSGEIDNSQLLTDDSSNSLNLDVSNNVRGRSSKQLLYRTFYHKREGSDINQQKHLNSAYTPSQNLAKNRSYHKSNINSNADVTRKIYILKDQNTPDDHVFDPRVSNRRMAEAGNLEISSLNRDNTPIESSNSDIAGSDFIQSNSKVPNESSADVIEDVTETDEVNDEPAIIENTVSPGAELVSKANNKNVNVNANVNTDGNVNGPQILVSGRQRSTIIAQSSDDDATYNTGPTIIVSARRKLSESENNNENVNQNVNVNSEKSDGPIIAIEARRKLEKNDDSNDSSKTRINQVNQVNDNNKIVLNPIFAISTRRKLKDNANKNANTNVNTNVIGNDNEDTAAVLQPDISKLTFGIGSRRNHPTSDGINRKDINDPIIGIFGRKNGNKNVNINTNVNSDSDDDNSSLLVAARSHGLQAEASYGGKKNSGTSSGVRPYKSRKNNNENSNVNANVNVNAENGEDVAAIIASARKRLTDIVGDGIRKSTGGQQKNRRSHHLQKSENRNVNINVNRLENDEV